MANTIQATFGLDVNPLQQAANRAVGISKNMAAAVGGHIKSFITSPLLGISSAVGTFFTYKAFAAGIQGVITSGAALEGLSRQTGMAKGSLATMLGVFGQADVSADRLAMTVAHMQRNLFDAARGGGMAGATLRNMGLDVRSLLKEKPEKQFKEIGMAIAGVSNPAARASAAMSLFGKSGTELMPVFDEMSNVDFGQLSLKSAILARDAESFHKTTMAFRKARTQLNNVFVGMADALAPTLQLVGSALSAQNALAFGITLGKSIKDATEVLVGIFANPSALWEAFTNTGMAAVASIGNTLYAGFYGAATYFVEGMSLAFNYASSFCKRLGGGLLGAAGSLTDGFLSAVLNLQSGLEYAFQKGIEIFRTGMNEAISWMSGAMMWVFDKIKEGLGKLPIIGEKAGLKGFQGVSLDAHVAAERARFAAVPKAEGFDAIKARNALDPAMQWGALFKGAGQDLIDAADAEIPKALADFKKNVQDAFRVGFALDPFGAIAYGAAAQAALMRVKKSGEEALAQYTPKAALTNKPSAMGTGLLIQSTLGGLSSPTNATGMNQFHPVWSEDTGGMTGGIGVTDMQNAIKSKSMLSARENASFENAAVAQGGKRAGTTSDAYNHIRAGDVARQRAAEKEAERKEKGIGTNNQLLGDILSTLKDAFE